MRTGARDLLLALMAFLVGSAVFVPAASARAITSLGLNSGTNHARPVQGHAVASSSLSRYVYDGTASRAAGGTAATFDLLRNPRAEPRLVWLLLSDYDAQHLLRETRVVLATNTPKPPVGPAVDEAFQFPGAGRSGAAVKNFVGPPNAVVKGASPGRVFMTDGQGRVILDITADRVKPVVPGQGFVAGDGRKLAPTTEQLGWIKDLWG